MLLGFTPLVLNSSFQVKCDALKGCILAMLNGERFPRVMMTVIRFCVNTESHELKKLLTLFWEVRTSKTSRDHPPSPHPSKFPAGGFENLSASSLGAAKIV